MKKEFLERNEELKEMRKEKAIRGKRKESSRNNINSISSNNSSVINIVSSNNNICVRGRWDNK